jgi:hypothetical protein
MTDKVEVYVKLKEVGASEDGAEKSFDLYARARMARGVGIKTARGVRAERIMPEADRTTLEVASQFAHKMGLPVETCNVCTLAGRLKARLKGIRTTPTIIIGKFRIEGQITLDQLRMKLESIKI